MRETMPEGQEKNNAEREYEEQLGVLFEQKREEWVRHAESLLNKTVGAENLAETYRAELAKDIVQDAFLSLLEQRLIDFSMTAGQIQNYVSRQMLWKIQNWAKTYYGRGAKNPAKIAEKNFLPLKKAKNAADSSLPANPHLQAESLEQKTILEEMLRTLPEREAEVLKMRFARPPYDREYTLEEIGKKFNVTRERIKQIERKALRRLQYPIRANKLKNLL